jgi:hypothetical protein
MPSTDVGCDDGAMTTGLGSAVPWFAVRCIFAIGRGDDDEVHTYEERITLWRASHFDEAIALAEAEATEYATAIEGGRMPTWALPSVTSSRTWWAKVLRCSR